MSDAADARRRRRWRPEDDVLDDRTARAVWSALAEPGDLVAGALVSALGPGPALRVVPLAARVGLGAAWARVLDDVSGGDRPSSGDDRPSSGGDRPPSGGDRPPSSGDGPISGGDSRPFSGDSPLICGDSSVFSGDSPLAGGDRPPPGGPRLERAVQRWGTRLAEVDAWADLAALEGVGGSFLVPGDAGWPLGLDDLGLAAPFGLWVRGRADLERDLRRSVALVGSRAATTYGERVAVDIAAGLVDAGASVVSGGAYGIDAAAHRGALARGGRTVVLLAGGVDRSYPAGNARMFEAVVASGGALVAEVPPGRLPTKSRFLQRNRLIAAGSGATVVVEAAWRSGAMSTAHHAVRLLRPVGAVPGPVTSVASAGCHRLMREGSAVCVTDAAEVMDLAGLVGADLVDEPAETRRRGDGLAPGVQRVLEALPLRVGAEAEAVAVRAGVTLGEARSALGLLELDGLAERNGSRWRMVPGPGPRGPR